MGCMVWIDGDRFYVCDTSRLVVIKQETSGSDGERTVDTARQNRNGTWINYGFGIEMRDER